MSLEDRKESFEDYNTLCIHGDLDAKGVFATPDVAPPLHTSTTYTISAEDIEAKLAGKEVPGNPIAYCREDNPTRRRAEAIIGRLNHGKALLFSSGQTATHACMLAIGSKRVYVSKYGYHGTKLVLELMKRLNDSFEYIIGYPEPDGVQKGDLIWIESPRNPDLDVMDISSWAKICKAKGAKLVVDATVAPAPLQQPLLQGADLVMYSATKFMGGHSDILCGAVVFRDVSLWYKLFMDRITVGGVPGNMEAWLLLRSLRTITLRLRAHSENAAKIAHALQTDAELKGFVECVDYPTAYAKNSPEWEIVSKQFPYGLYGGLLAITLSSEEMAKRLPAHLKLFGEATSLGGVESLADWRRKWDEGVPGGLLRLSIGLENPDSLIEDLRQALKAVSTATSESSGSPANL
eukprot:Clim_evm83s149 gene=Clim_evmTU83s149